MRSKERIDDFLKEFGNIWKEQYQDYRFGQLLSNFFGWLYTKKKMDLFFPEEDKMIEYFKEFSGRK